MADLTQRLRELESSGALSLAPPGRGDTPRRHLALFEVAREDLGLARLAEAHVDALAILAEAGRARALEKLYGVWASDGPHSRLEMRREDSGRLVLNGVKKYCSGAKLLDRALVTAYDDGRRLLLDVPLSGPGLQIDDSDWVTPAFAATSTATVRFNSVTLEATAIVGGPEWYLTRPGFWHGALGPAACWAGGAAGLTDAVRGAPKNDPHFRAHLGALEASGWGLMAFLTEAGRQIDADPDDHTHTARKRTLMARHLIERQCTDVLDRFGRATGPALLAFDSSVVQRHLDLTLYIRQCHAERDLETIPDP